MVPLEKSERDHKHQTISGNTAGPNIVQACVLQGFSGERGSVSLQLQHSGREGQAGARQQITSVRNTDIDAYLKERFQHDRQRCQVRKVIREVRGEGTCCQTAVSGSVE